MELDSRILEGKKPLDCFDTEIAKEFIGKKGYFADNDYAFIDITSDDYPISYATLTSVDEFHRIAFYDNFDVRHYYFLPAEWVKKPEKKYRPFSLEEFLKIFDIGDQIGFRSKDNGEVKHAMFVGYTDDFFADNSDRSDGENNVMIGIYRFSLSYLFDNYELLLEDGWQPFGIEE